MADEEPPASPGKSSSQPPMDPKEPEGLSPAERAALYKAQQRAAGQSPPARAAGPPPAASKTPPQAPRPGPAAAAPPEPEPEPEEVRRLRGLCPELQFQRVHGYMQVTIPAARLLELARCGRDELGFDYLSSVTGVDWKDHFQVLYHLYSFDYQHQPGCLVLVVELPHEQHPTLDSLTPLWPGAAFQEREVWDLMGMKFLGHPDLRRILLADDFPGHPLRKDFVFDYEYVLVPHLRHGAEGQAEEPHVPPHDRPV